MPVDFRYAALSDVGLRRRNNQDSGYAGSHLLVLCDGMGGPAGGDIASSIAVAHLVDLDTDDHPADHMLHLLRRAIRGAHEELVDRSSVDPQLHGLGTTCIALMRSGNKLALVHIGDSRAYLLRDGELTQVTTDHSFVQYLIETGQITPEEAETHPQRSVVLRVLGDSAGDVTLDESLREAVIGDRWLLCSDGLSGVVSPETILETLVSVEDPSQCAENLVQLALRAGGPDNITVVVADVVDSESTTPQPPQIVGAAAVDRSRPSRGGSGAAARAAALNQEENYADEDDEDEPVRKRRSWMLPVFVLVLWLALMAGGWLGYSWTQQQYYAQINDNHLVIYQGIPQDLWLVKLSHPVEVTSVDIDALQPVERDRLQEPVRRSSRDEIDAYVEQLQRSQETTKKTNKTGSSSSLPPTSQPVARLTESPSPKLRYPSESNGDG